MSPLDLSSDNKVYVIHIESCVGGSGHAYFHNLASGVQFRIML